MAEFASSDDQVKLNIFSERQQEASAEFDEEDPDAWKTQLTYQKKTAQIENTLHNLKLIMENDDAMKQIVFNQLADGMEIRDPVTVLRSVEKYHGNIPPDSGEMQMMHS